MRRQRGPGILLAFVSTVGILGLRPAYAAGQVTITGANQGATPFISDITATVSGGTVSSVLVGVLSKPGSLVAPFTTNFSAAYLNAHGDIEGNKVIVPAFGLYAGANNTLVMLYTFTDGSSAIAIEPVTTKPYIDDCAPINAPTIAQHRTLFSNNIGFNYFLLKDFCSKHDPAIVDTDGYTRWVGTDTAPGKSIPSILYKNAIYVANGGARIARIDLPTGQVTNVADFSNIGVTDTGQHNMDPGRDGVVVEADTSTETEGVAVEFDPITGAVDNVWDMAKILSAAMVSGGDNPANFVGPVGSDWFHMNATTYNPGDGTEIISSRENFVIDVDYDTPADGVKKIHWILGDTTKKWATFPSLAKFALTPGVNTFVPIGQHGISIDHLGNLMLFDDGNGSSYQVPLGITRGYSAGRSYKINTAAMTATEVVNYTPLPHIYATFCGSFYEQTPNNYLIDFATAAGDTKAELQGINSANHLVFDLQYAQTATTHVCGAGWNALPLPNTTLQF